jgi:hypothetical protein
MWLNMQLALWNRNKERQEWEQSIYIEERKEIWNNELLTIKWLWEWSVAKLLTIWIKNKDDLLKSNIDDVKKVITSPITIWIINNFINN